MDGRARMRDVPRMQMTDTGKALRTGCPSDTSSTSGTRGTLRTRRAGQAGVTLDTRKASRTCWARWARWANAAGAGAGADLVQALRNHDELTLKVQDPTKKGTASALLIAAVALSGCGATVTA